MTVNTKKITSGPYVGNNVADTFSYTFRIEDKNQLNVYQTDDNEVQTLLTVDTDYTVNGIGVDAGGTIELTAGPLLVNYELYIKSNFDETQLTSFESQGGFFPEVHESAMDKLTYLIQQLLDRISRSLQLSDGFSGTVSTVIPDPVPGHVLVWDHLGENLVSVPLNTDGTLLKSVKVPVDIVADQTLYVLDSPITVENMVVVDGRTLKETGLNSAYSITEAGELLLSEPLDVDQTLEVFTHILLPASESPATDVVSLTDVETMVSTNLKAGFTVFTHHHTFEGDGGHSPYKIVKPEDFTGVIDSAHILLNNLNIAVLLHNGTVYIEQLGVVGIGTYSDQINDAVNLDGVTRVLSSTPAATFDTICFIEKDNVTVDLSKTLITYIGDCDVYTQFGIGTDRSIGFINSRGVLGTDTATVSSSIVDGTNVLTLDDASPFSVGDYIQLNIVYPRRSDEQVTRIASIDGDDITIDYTFGWTVTSCAITKIDTMRQNNHIKLNLYDNSPATIDAHKISGIGLEYSANCSASWNVENHNYPALITNYCQDIELSNGFATNPKDITSGRGYNCQLNNSQRINANNMVSRRCRHNWDASGASFCTLSNSYAYSPADNISQYTTHGIYEHDILFDNCYQFDGQNAFSIAQSGVAFGSQNRRVRIYGGRFNGLVKSENAKQFTMENVDFYGTQVAEHEFSATEGTLIKNVNFNTSAQIRITVPADITGTDGIPSITDSIIFENVDFNDNKMRTTDVLGSVKYLRCKNFGLLSDSDLTNYPYNVVFEECELDIIKGWEVKPINSLVMTDNTIDLDASISFSAGAYVQMTGGNINSSNSNIRLKFNAPVVKVDDVITENSVGIFAEADCTKFNLTNVKSINPDASHTSNQFTTEGTTDCAFVINGMNVDYTGSGKSILFVNTGLQAIITGSYIEGTISHAGATTKSFAGNITPDTVLP